RWAWSPWQPRIYYRGLHPAWRTFDLKRETGNQEVNPGSSEPTGAAPGPPRWGEGVRRKQQAGSSLSLGEGPAVPLDISKNRTWTCGRGHLESSAAWRPGVRAVGSEVPTTVIIIVTTYESTVCQAFPEGVSGPLKYKECFSLYDKQQRGKIKAPDLIVVMRCLGASPTPGEVQQHLRTHGIDRNGELDFSTFLTIMHMQIKQEDPKKEILLAMLMADKEKKGYIMASELRSKLMKLGEKLTHKEVDDLFREANVEPNGKVKYDEFIRKITIPARDYTE
uniref:Calmodulin-like protein 4 n=1 Tax=Rhinolophus ferrumequinum TaxID=59479 RepID=A0A671DVH7_RHIFE